MAAIVKVECIEEGPQDYQNEIKSLRAALAHKTALCDKVEGQKAYQTREIRRLSRELEEQTELNTQLREEKAVLHNTQIQEKQAWIREKVTLLEQVDLCKALTQAKQICDSAQETSAIFTSMIEQERASKRQRTRSEQGV